MASPAERKKGTMREELFAAAFTAMNFDATKAAIAVGLSPATATQAASRMLSKVNVQEMIKANMARAMNKYNVTLERVVEEMARCGFSNMMHYTRLDNDGLRLIDFSSAGEAEMAAVSQIEVTERINTDDIGQSILSRTTKIKLHDKGSHLLAFYKQLTADAQGVSKETNEGETHYHVHVSIPKTSQTEERSYREAPFRPSAATKTIEHEPKG